MSNQIVTNELPENIEFPFLDLYADLRQINSIFANKVLSFPDFDPSAIELKQIWDAFWDNSKNHTLCGWKLLQVLDTAVLWQDIKDYMLSVSAKQEDSKPCEQIKPSMVSRQQEKSKELDLLFWLESCGHEVERQVKVGKERLDLWIPGQLVLELKAGRVNANDACQAIGYYSSCQRQICLVGASINDSATKAIDAVNGLMKQECIVFVPWVAVKPYLESKLKNK